MGILATALWHFIYTGLISSNDNAQQPDTRELTWLKNVGVPGRFENDWVYVDFALLGDENNIYIGTTAGTLFSFYTNDQQFQYLGTPY